MIRKVKQKFRGGTICSAGRVWIRHERFAGRLLPVSEPPYYSGTP